MRRRTFLLGAGAAVAAVACGDDSVTTETTAPPATTSTTSSTLAPATTSTTLVETTTTQPASVAVSLPSHPSWSGSVAVPDQALLDSLASEYVAAVGDAAEMERFLYGTAPVVVFERIFDDPMSADVPGLIWVMFLSGYFGGRWLRAEIARAQPDAPLVGFSVEPSEETFRAGEALAQAALTAASGTGDALLAYADASLVDQPPPAGSQNPIRGLTDNFGYNQGYMLEILESPPEGLETPARYQISCDRLLWCEYASPQLDVMQRYRPASERLADPDDPAAVALAARLAPFEQESIPRGRSVWSSGLSVQGFPQKSYDQLLDVSSSFLETVQVTANAMVQAVLDDDTEAARAGAVANAAMTIWLGAYSMGLLDGSDPIEFPVFV